MLSVAIPVYNNEDYIGTCLDSILGQTYRDIEIIVIDDGSKDSSGAICDSYARTDNRIRVVHKKNGGVSEARNDGIRLANGEYIMFCDSDDTYEPDFCETMYKYVSGDKFMVICGLKYSNNNGEIIYSHRETDIIPRDKFLYVYNKSLIGSPTNKIYSLDVIRKNKISFNPDISLGEDLIFNMDYLSHFDKMLIINRCLYNYNIRDDFSLTSKYRENMYEIQMLIAEHINKFTESFNIQKNDEYYKMYFNIINYIMRNNMHSGSDISRRQAIRLNNKILKNDKVIKNMPCRDMNTLMYKTGKFRFVKMYLTLSRIRRKWRKK